MDSIKQTPYFTLSTYKVCTYTITDTIGGMLGVRNMNPAIVKYNTQKVNTFEMSGIACDKRILSLCKEELSVLHFIRPPVRNLRLVH